MRSITNLGVASVAAGILFGGPVQAQSQTLILEAQGSVARRLPAGAYLAGPVTLERGDVLTLLNETGSFIWRGPGAFAPGMTTPRPPRAGPPSRDRRERVGAVRTLRDGPWRPITLSVDVASPGAVCVTDATLKLWRPEASQGGEGSLSGPAGASAALTWTAGQSLQDWPQAIPFIPGGQYRFRTPGEAQETTVVIKRLAVVPSTPAEAAAALIAEGCQSQLDEMVAILDQHAEAAAVASASVPSE